MKSIDSLLTLVLPVKGGIEYTLRLLEYLNKNDFPYKIIIADGSKDESLGEYLSENNKYNEIDYIYKKYPFDESYLQFYTKMVSVLSEIKSPYVSLIDSDSFPINKGLNESVMFLESHPEYSTCRGQHIDFRLKPSVNDEDNYLYGCELSIDQDYFDKKHGIWDSFECDNALSRISKWSYSMNVMFYNIHKTEILLEAWRFILNNDYMDLYLIELTVALIALVNGKSKVIDVPFMLRQQNSTYSVSKEAIKKNDILDRMLIEKWTVELNNLIKYISKISAPVMGCTENETSDEIRNSIKNYYADRLYSYLKERDGNKYITTEGDKTKITKDLKGDVKNVIITKPSQANKYIMPVVCYLLKQSKHNNVF